jgi:predicted MFS family arabinose efflux permease
MSAVALSAGSYNVMGIVGPAAVGLMLAFIAPEQVYLVIIAFYVFGAVMLTFLKLPAGTSRLPGLSLSGLGEAFRFIGRERVVLGMLLTALTLSLFCIPYIYLLPALASDVLKVDQTGFGFLCAAAGTGALMGSLIAGSLASVRRKGMAVLLLAALFGAFLCLSGQSQAYPLALLLILCTALASSACMTLCNTLILTMTPPAMHGRVISIFTMTTGLTPMGALPMGAAADHFTLPVAFMASGIIAGTFAVSMWLASPSIRKMRQ